VAPALVRRTSGSCSDTTSPPSPAPGPLVGPTLAAQFGYLPGTLWILVGVRCSPGGGCVQDYRDPVLSRRARGQRALPRPDGARGTRPVAGLVALVGILAIMIILLAVLAPRGGQRAGREPVGRVHGRDDDPDRHAHGPATCATSAPARCSTRVIGIVAAAAGVWGGQVVHGTALERLVHARGHDARVVRSWATACGLTSCRCGCCSRRATTCRTFMKIGTIWRCWRRDLRCAPDLKMPAITQFIDGTGPVWPAPLFPFVFITIACGAISGFHALISSGTTPKLLDEREPHPGRRLRRHADRIASWPSWRSSPPARWSRACTSP
jgi:carbon starvation protein